MKNKQIYGVWISVSLFGCLLIGFQNCSQPSKLKLPGQASNTSEDSSDGQFQAKPVVSCNIYRHSDHTLLRRINSYTNQSSSIAPFVEGEAIDMDCSQSVDSEGVASGLTFKVDFDTRSASGVVVNTSGQFQYTFPIADTYPLSIELVDSKGRSSVKLTDDLVRCSGSVPAINIDGNSITVSRAGTPGFYVFNYSGSVAGGRPPFKYAWDFDGDTGLDNQFSAAGGNVSWYSWSDSPRVDNAYSIFWGNRNVRLIVRDSCNIIANREVVRNFDHNRIPAASPAVASSPYYLQGDVRKQSSPGPASTQTDRVASSDLNILGVPVAQAPDRKEHVKCSYSRDNSGKGILNVTALNNYGTGDLVELNQGVKLKIVDIADTGAAGTIAVGANVKILNAEYNVAARPDMENQTVYAKPANQGACSMQLRLVRAIASVPCSSGPPAQAQTLTFTGEFNCPLLSSSYGNVQIQNGKFYCEESLTDQCVGGGGGGGGQPPHPH